MIFKLLKQRKVILKQRNTLFERKHLQTLGRLAAGEWGTNFYLDGLISSEIARL